MGSDDRKRLYAALDQLRDRLRGFRFLRDATGRDGWPERGVYFFSDQEEPRANGDAPRVIRVGTHALKVMGTTTLWRRLRQHRGDVRVCWSRRSSE